MRVVVLFNARSGRGKAAAVAKDFAESLSRLGHEVVLQETGPGTAPATRNAEALVIAGGDGTLHHAVVELVRTMAGPGSGSPPGLYQVPLGTENLFAREFGMTADPQRLGRLLAAGTPRPLDVGLCNGRPFVLMCGIGPDAGVLVRLNQAAANDGHRGPITKWSYFGPVVRELMELRVPRLSISVDGNRVVHERQGLLVIGNSRQYAVRLDPAVRASMSDGLLDAVFFPARGRASITFWAAASRLRLHTRSRRLIYRTGRRFDVSTGGRPTPYQLDGEAFTSDTGELTIGIMPGALRVWA